MFVCRLPRLPPLPRNSKDEGGPSPGSVGRESGREVESLRERNLDRLDESTLDATFESSPNTLHTLTIREGVQGW